MLLRANSRKFWVALRICTYRITHAIGICSEMCKDGMMNGIRKQVLRKPYTHDNVLTIHCTCTIVRLNQYLHGGKTQPNCQKYHTTTSTLEQLHFFLIFPGQHLNTAFKYRLKCNSQHTADNGKIKMPNVVFS